MTQEERLDDLIRELIKEDVDRWETEIPDDVSGKRDLLRSLMNVREAKPVSDAFLREQDAYLAQRLLERGVTDAEALPDIRTAYGSTVSCADRIVLFKGDITCLKADVIVNAANAQMLGCFKPLHACIDNCIHTYAGVQLRLACDAQMKKIREKVGEAYLQPTAIPMLTDAYNLPASKIAHVVGPIVEGALTERHREQLAACYRNTLALCDKNGFKSVAFCCISTGVFGFPQEEAARIAVETVTDCLQNGGKTGRVIFNVFTEKDLSIYRALLQNEHAPGAPGQNESS